MAFEWLASKRHKEEPEVVLPDGESQLETEREPIQADNEDQAQKKCEEIAAEYGGFDAKADPVGKREFDCRFKLWR